VAIDAVQFPGLSFVVEVGLSSLLGQSQRIVILVTVDAGSLKGVSLGMLDLTFGFPIETFRVFEPFCPYIAGAGFRFFDQIPFAMGWKMAVHTIDRYAPLVIVVGGEFPAVCGMRMDVTGSAIIVGGCFYYYLVTQEDKQCGHNYPRQK
jgi:hypothetical protein